MELWYLFIITINDFNWLATIVLKIFFWISLNFLLFLVFVFRMFFPDLRSVFIFSCNTAPRKDLAPKWSSLILTWCSPFRVQRPHLYRVLVHLDKSCQFFDTIINWFLVTLWLFVQPYHASFLKFFPSRMSWSFHEWPRCCKRVLATCVCERLPFSRLRAFTNHKTKVSLPKIV